MDYRRALELAQIDTLSELYQAAEHSGVKIRDEPTADESARADVVADVIRGQARLRAA